MAERTGKCTNYTTCTLAYRNQPITVSGDFVCPECGKPLQPLTPVKAKGAGGPLAQKQLIIGGAVGLVVLILLVVGLGQCRKGPSEGPPVAQGTPGPEKNPDTPPTPLATPPPIPDKPPTIAETTPEPTPPAVPEQPAPPVSSPEKIDVDLSSKENRDVRQEVLKRIDQMPTLTDKERDALYTNVDKARGMGKLITIPFDAGKTTLSPAAVDQLQQVTQSPEVAKMIGDPTVVFVILGFADKSGDAKKNLQVSNTRADSVVKTLREKCGLQNLMHSVGMGGSEFFQQGDLSKNRVAEVWAVLP